MIDGCWEMVVKGYKLCLMLLVAPSLGVAQELAPVRGEVAGRVVDADSQVSLAGAVVVLEPAPAGAVWSSVGGAAFPASAITTETNGVGAYRFEGLGSGTYVIRVMRLGYQPARVEIELHGAAMSRVTLGLVVAPIALAPVRVAVDVSPIMERAVVSEEVDARRIRSVEERQERFLESDVRSMGYTDMLEAVTLGETDIFRALQRLPGVSTRDDYTAQLWTRGAPWGQTRVYFDGVPLFNPVHMGGFFSGVSPEAVGTVFFHPGVRPASIGEGAAGVVSLSSRPARPHESIPLRSEITLASLRATSEARFWDDKGGVLVSGRRSWWDWATETAADQATRPEDIVAFALMSWSGVFDYSWGEHNRVEVSALFEEDQLDGGIPGVIDGNFGRWGNEVQRVSFDTRISDLPLRFTVGNSRYRGDVWQDDSLRRGSNLAPDVVTLDTAFGEVLHSFVRGELTGERVGARPARWTLGMQWTGQSTTSLGAAIPIEASGDQRRALHGGELEYGVVYGEYLLQPSSDVTIRAGLRWETGGTVQNGGQDRVAPRISSRFQLTPRVALSAAFGRSFQYTQTIGEVGNSFGLGLHFAQRWLLAGESSPMIQSDIATVGLESWIGGGWLASTTAYARHATGVAVPDPRTGSVFPPDWPGAEP